MGGGHGAFGAHPAQHAAFDHHGGAFVCRQRHIGHGKFRHQAQVAPRPWRKKLNIMHTPEKL